MTVLEPEIVLVPRRSWRLALPRTVAIAGIPALFVVVGLLIRYFAYAAAVDAPSLADFADGLCRWDCSWYVYIAEHGYQPFPTPNMSAGGNWAFFPFAPILVGLVRLATGLPTMPLATGISIAMSYVTALLAWPLLNRDLRAHTLFSAYLLAGPFSIYFTTFMTEAAFILLTTGVLVALERRAYLSAGVVAGILSATRIVGVFMAVAMFAQLVADHLSARKPIRSFIPELLKRPDILLGLLLAPLGAFIYMAFLRWWIGDGLAFLHVQRAWARAYGNPLVFMWDALTTFPKENWLPTAPEQLAAAVITGFVLIAVLFRRRQWAGGTFSLISLVLPLFAGMASTLRFTAALAPVAILAMRLLSANRMVFAAALLVFMVGDYYVTMNWISGALSLV